MKRASVLLIIILVFNISLVIVNGDTINTNEYDAYKVYESSTKVIIDDNQVVPDGANILLLDKYNKKIISVDKSLIGYYDKYEFIGYEVNNMPFIYKNADKMLEFKIYPIKARKMGELDKIKEKILNDFYNTENKIQLEKIEPTKETNLIMLFLCVVMLSLICYLFAIDRSNNQNKDC